MNTNIKNYVLLNFVCIHLSVFLSYFLWDLIKLNYSNKYRVVSHYLITKQHILNGSLKFLFFVCATLLINLLISFFILKSQFLKNKKIDSLKPFIN